MFFGQCEPHGRRQSASLLWMLVWKRSSAWMSRRDVREWYGYAFGLPDRHPTGFLWRGSMPTWSRPVPFGAGWKRVARGGLRTG